jgi:4-hydroxy-tetrahydrodipicolinate reductase
MKPLRVVLFGTGRVGRDVTRLVSRRPGVSIVAALSRNPEHQGRDIGSLSGVDPLGVRVTGDREAALAETADVVSIATTSFFSAVTADITASVNSGKNVLCTAEEMAFPWAVDQEGANALDRLARERGVTVAGSGLNPGLLFDALVLTVLGLAWDVQSIHVRRVVNCSRFSPTVLRRLGFGFTRTEFTDGAAAGRIYGHIGFPQSIRAVGNRIEVQTERMEKAIEPLIADREYRMDRMTISPGHSAGFRQRVMAFSAGRPWFTAELIGHVAPEEAGFEREDTINIEGEAPVHLSLRPGCDAQSGSAAMVANSLRRVVEAPPGLLTVGDLPPACPTFTRPRE